MATQNIFIFANFAGLPSAQVTAKIDRSAHLLVATRWRYTHAASNATFSSWLHPDTAAPSLDDPTNLMIMRETQFIVGKDLQSAEVLPQCLAIPDTHHNLTFRVTNPGLLNFGTVNVSYQFQ